MNAVIDLNMIDSDVGGVGAGAGAAGLDITLSRL
jgi:hypothetical protein